MGEARKDDGAEEEVRGEQEEEEKVGEEEEEVRNMTGKQGGKRGGGRKAKLDIFTAATTSFRL